MLTDVIMRQEGNAQMLIIGNRTIQLALAEVIICRKSILFQTGFPAQICTGKYNFIKKNVNDNECVFDNKNSYVISLSKNVNDFANYVGRVNLLNQVFIYIIEIHFSLQCFCVFIESNCC